VLVAVLLSGAVWQRLGGRHRFWRGGSCSRLGRPVLARIKDSQNKPTSEVLCDGSIDEIVRTHKWVASIIP